MLEWLEKHPRIQILITLPLVFAFRCYHTVLCVLDRMGIIDYEYADADKKK